MRAAEVLFCLKYASIVYAASDVPRPRGVGPECELNAPPMALTPALLGEGVDCLKLTTVTSCKVLQRHQNIHLYIEPLNQRPLCTSKR